MGMEVGWGLIPQTYVTDEIVFAHEVTLFGKNLFEETALRCDEYMQENWRS